MGIAKISKEIVFITASRIHKEGQKPTVSKVRARLGEGSTTTVHKYLTEWKMQHSNGVRLDPAQLEQKLSEQLKISEKLSLEIFNSSSLVAHERSENAKLQARVLELETRLEEKVHVNQELITQFTLGNKTLQETFEKTLAMLTDQLSAVNEQAIRKVQEVGHHFDERIIENKLAMRDLQEQLVLKEKELNKHKLYSKSEVLNTHNKE